MVNGKLKILARGSTLSVKQVDEVMSYLPGFRYELAEFKTYGDCHKEISLFDNNDPDFFTREIDDALLSGQGDIAIHSAKDMPFPLKDGLKLIALTKSSDNSDSLVCRNGFTLNTLAAATRIGTSSLSRKQQLLTRRPDLEIVSIRGTIDERIHLLDSGKIDGLIVATCALKRLGLENRISEILDFTTNPLQGMLGIVARKENFNMENLFSFLDVRKNYGRVYLAGFGPGNPEYLTVKTRRLLEIADVIFYDNLVDHEFIQNLKVKKIYVGKRAGNHSKTQDEINELLFQSAINGKLVVRLKGGDPFIFGRGGEEFHYLLERYVRVEIVPGVTSALAGAAETGIPLTHRNISASVIFSSGNDTENIQFNPTGTTVIYMGSEKTVQIIRKAIESGYDPETPVAVLTNISLDKRKISCSVLSEVAASEPHYETPGLIIIGKTINPALIKHYEESLPKVLVTGTSAAGFEKYGRIVHQPLIAIQAIPDNKTFEILNRINEFNLVIFTSRNAVIHFFEKVFAHKNDSRILSGKKILSIGNVTSKELKNYGILADLQPPEESSEGILEFCRRNNIRNSEILIPRSLIGLAKLPEGLKNLGNKVTVLEIYKNVFPENIQKHDLSDFEYVAFSSPSGVDNFCRLYTEIPKHLKFIVKGNETRKRMIDWDLQDYRDYRELSDFQDIQESSIISNAK